MDRIRIDSSGGYTAHRILRPVGIMRYPIRSNHFAPPAGIHYVV